MPIIFNENKTSYENQNENENQNQNEKFFLFVWYFAHLIVNLSPGIDRKEW